MTLFEIKNVKFPKTIALNSAWKITGDLALLGISYVLPVWVVVNVHYPKQFIEILGAPINSKIGVALLGKFAIEFSDGFAREGDYTVDVMAYVGPTTQVSAGPVTSISAPIPPIPAVASIVKQAFTVGGQPPPSPLPGTAGDGMVFLTKQVNPPQSGDFNILPGQASYRPGDSVRLQAVPWSGWRLDHWEVNGKLLGYTDMAFTVPASNAVITAFFTDTQKVTFQIDPPGSGKVSAIPQAESYHAGQTVQLTAVPNTGWYFLGWFSSGAGWNQYESYDPQFNYVMPTQSRTLTAKFDKYLPPVPPATWQIGVSAQASPAAGGTATVKPVDYTVFVKGSKINLSAVPNPGWRFDYWDLNGTRWVTQAQLLAYLPENDVVFTAHFVQS